MHRGNPVEVLFPLFVISALLVLHVEFDMEKLRVSFADNDDNGSEEEFVDGDYASSDEDGDGAHKHSQLLDAVRLLDGKNNRSRMVQRTEASSTVSEFSLGNRAEDKLNVGDLLNELGKTTVQPKLKKALLRIEKGTDVLPPPLKKLEAAKVKRIVAYKSLCDGLGKWDKVVQQNRLADQLAFPLKQTILTMEPLERVVERCQFSTPLEKEIAELLQKREPEIKSGTNSREVNLRQLDLEEAIEMRQEMRRLRAQQTYQEAKSRRTNKIKSKRYHRILKREKLKKEMKEFEELQKINPELAAEKFIEMDNQRILERMTLRHRNTGKWAKYQLLRSKHDKESGRIIQEQIELNRALTAKKFVPSDSEDDAEPRSISGEERENVFFKMPQADSTNPWNAPQKVVVNEAHASSTAHDETDPTSVNYRKYWTEENKKKTGKICVEESDEDSQTAEETEEENELNTVALSSGEIQRKKDGETAVKYPSSNLSHGMDEVDEIFSHAANKKTTKNKLVDEVSEEPKLKKRKRKTKTSVLHKPEAKMEPSIEETLMRKNTLQDFDNMPAEEAPKNMPAPKLQTTSVNNTGKVQASDMLDPNNFFTVKQRIIKCKAPNMENYDDDEIDDVDDREQHMAIVEAFADCDVVQEFKMEKQAIIDRDTPKDIDLTLPGWGVWGGSDTQNSNGKRKRFILKAPPAPIRKDSNIGNAIISEHSEENLRPYMVSKIPFPYTSVKEFEESIKAPVGKQWNPETAFQRVIAPKILSRMGTIIEPMDADAIKGESSRTISYL